MQFSHIYTHNCNWDIISNTHSKQIKEIQQALSTAFEEPDTFIGISEKFTNTLSSLKWFKSTFRENLPGEQSTSFWMQQHRIQAKFSYIFNTLETRSLSKFHNFNNIPEISLILYCGDSSLLNKTMPLGERYYSPEEVAINYATDLKRYKAPYSFAIIFINSWMNVFGPTKITPLESIKTYHNPIIEKVIEFPPEYYQAGMGIISHFATYLKNEYPEEKATVAIEQDEGIVRMIITTESGENETIEKALDDYQLVFKNELKPERIAKNQDAISQLYHEKKMLEYRVKSLIKINAALESENDRYLHVINSLTDAIGNGSGRSSNIYINSPSLEIEANSTAKTEINTNISQTINNMVSEVGQLASKIKDPEIASELNEIENELKPLENEESKEVVKSSPVISKLKRFLDKVSNGNEKVTKAIETTEKGIEIARKLAGNYNKIAQWCALPQVPDIFTK